MDEASAISVDALNRRFGKFTAVDSISFNVARGEIFGLLGPNGAGKTTTLSMMTGLLRPSGGHLIVNGVDMLKRPRDVRPGIGVVPQGIALYGALSARNNLQFFGRLYDIRGARLRERIDAVLAIAGLGDRADDVVDTFSGGMKRRLNLAVALLHEPRILFLDEPTVGVDPQSRNAIFESVEALRDKGMTVVYTTHYMEEAERLCDKVAIIDHGKVVAIDSPQGLKQRVGEGYLTVELDSGQLDPLIATLRQSPLFLDIRVTGQGQMEIDASPLQDALMHFIDCSRRCGVRITALNIARPSLETVFLRLTGSRLRDA